MNTFPEDIKFCKTWRPYQARVLEELEEHLDDNHLHIVAAPGSGKTVLGLEVMRCLDNPALIFAPTLAIRDQWVDRFIHLFCSSNPEYLNVISKDIKNPKLLTVSTYQGLHSVYTDTAEQQDDEEEEQDGEIYFLVEEQVENQQHRTSLSVALAEKLKQAQIKTIVVDEAHHLRSEWWKCLIDVKGKLQKPTIVALTATPPYDVSHLEWKRYKKLCGPVDAEISVPELVRENNLCPHQDYVYFSTPRQKENVEIEKFRDNVRNFARDICRNQDFINIVANHPKFLRPQEHIEAILSDPAFYSAIAIFLKHLGRKIPKQLLKVLGIKAKVLPSLDLESLEILLTGCFFDHEKEFGENDEVLENISKTLRRFGAAEKRKVILRNPKQITRLLVSSASKLNSISEIVKIESGALNSNLRMVILTDFIRKADLPRTKDNLLPLKRIGVVPIFEQLRRDGIENIKLGVLSGSMAIIPESTKDLFFEIARSKGIEPSSIKLSVLNHAEDFYAVEISGADKHNMVALITKLFNEGAITVLVGTKSLLGEGWDAPAINCLILASFVGSYMLSNQMRGRAIRTQPSNPDKTSNIWHLVCVEKGQKELSDDLEMLTRRFKAFAGVSFKERIIENGIGRLNIGSLPFTAKKIESINTFMKQKALDRDGLRQSWKEILSSGGKGFRMVDEVRTTPSSLPRSFVFYNTILALYAQGILWGGFFLSKYRAGLEGLSTVKGTSMRRYFVMLAVGFIVAIIIAAPKCLKAIYLFIRHGPVSSSIEQIGKALVRSLSYAKLIKTPLSDLKVKAQKDEEGFVHCSLVGGTSYERCLFLDAMQEILGPINNPRYILMRRAYLGIFLRKDYHVVPQELARKREYAEYYTVMWSKYVGPTKLNYTRNIEGRLILLKARAHSLATSFQKRAERAKAWR
jgi:superfamily II DNA or RNA helicase